jgi:hypothetical protein
MRITGLVAVSLLLTSCLGKPKANRGETVFDMKAYFTKEAGRLSASRSQLLKSAAQNGVSQTLLIKAPDWHAELALFANSVIDKPSWAGQYKLLKGRNQSTWSTGNPSLHTKMLKVSTSEAGKVTRIDIHNSTDNVLYNSDEWLTYVADSGYTIRKDQKVRLLRENHYLVRGKIN